MMRLLSTSSLFNLLRNINPFIFCCLSVVLLIVKVDRGLIPWTIVCIPWIIKDIVLTIQKWNEYRGFSSREDLKILTYRQFASFADHLGSLTASTALCIFLSLNADVSGLFYCFLPMWLILLYTSFGIRLCIIMRCGEDMDGITGMEQATISVCYGRPNGYYFTLLNLLFQLLARGLQPFLIVQHFTDTTSHNNWSSVFAPSWVLIFVGICLSGILMSCAPVAHPSSSPELREHAVKFVFIVAAHILATILAVILSLTWLCDALGREYDGIDLVPPNNTISFAYTILPIVALYLFYMLLRSSLLTYANGYQAFLRGIQHQDTHAALIAATKNKAVLSVIMEKTWLLQTSSTLYTRMEHTPPIDWEIAIR